MTSLFIKFTIEPSAGVPVRQKIIATITGYREVVEKNKAVSECWSLNCPQILVGVSSDQPAVQQADLYKKEKEFFLAVNALDANNFQVVHHIPVKDVQYTTGIFAPLK